METYVKPIIEDVALDIVILRVGCNDISNKSLSANDIAESIINIGKYCEGYNVNNFTISSLINRPQKHLKHKLDAANTMLMNRRKNCGLVYIDDDNIKEEFVAQNK